VVGDRVREKRKTKRETQSSKMSLVEDGGQSHKSRTEYVICKRKCDGSTPNEGEEEAFYRLVGPYLSFGFKF